MLNSCRLEDVDEATSPIGAGGAAPGGRRLTAEQRRAQLVGIGLRRLADDGAQAATVDAVAAEAGISRSLLFHYFPTKRAFHLAVVQAAARRVLRAASPAPGTSGTAALRTALAGYLALVRRRRDLYVALTRGAGADPEAADILVGLRDAFATRLLALLGEELPTAGSLERLAVEGWLAMVEEVALRAAEARGVDAPPATVRAGEAGPDDDAVAAFLADALQRVRGAARR